MRVSPLIFFLYIIIGIFMFNSPIQVNAQSDLQPVIDLIREQLISDLRDEALETLGPDRLGAGYAALINFTVNPDISTATYYTDVEDAEDPTLTVYRVPLRYVFRSEDRNWHPLVQANLGYQTLSADFDIDTEESIEADWRTYGGSLAVGVEVQLKEGLKLLPIVNAGVVRIESDADYDGFLANSFLKPAFDGVVFDWEADAWLIGASVGIDYLHSFKSYDLNIYGSLTHNYIETYHSSSRLIDFNSQVTTLDRNVDAEIPTHKSIAVYPLALVVNIGNTTFLGNDRDALDFDYFFEGGLALEADISQRNWMLQKIRIGAKLIYGEDVTGWSLIFGYRF